MIKISAASNVQTFEQLVALLGPGYVGHRLCCDFDDQNLTVHNIVSHRGLMHKIQTTKGRKNNMLSDVRSSIQKRQSQGKTLKFPSVVNGTKNEPLYVET
jgi:hypothetical protein